MLQRHTYQDPQMDGDIGQALSPAYFIGLLKRRALYFAIPFLLVLAVGSVITVIWPAKYVAQGTILVQSQEIPSDLVRPTIAALANDRIQVIEQRVMTRDNLLGIAKKYQLTSGWLERLSGTEIVDFLRKRTVIKPSERRIQTGKKEAIAFTVGFEYENPGLAAKVANELVTMLLSEDARTRTEFAAETTRFLAHEVTRLQGQLATIDDQIIALRKTGETGRSPVDDERSLAALRAELIVKSATYSNNHPDIKALKRKIAALEKSGSDRAPPAANGDTAPSPVGSNPGSLSIDTLQTQRQSVRDELNTATQKLATAKLGENLERGQHSERLEVIEQPTVPQKPVSPNRPKIFGVVFALAFMAGGGAVFAAEFLNQAIRTRTDLFPLIDRQLIVSIPYIATKKEKTRKRRRMLRALAVVLIVVAIGFIVLFFILPPLDLIFDKLMNRLSG